MSDEERSSHTRLDEAIGRAAAILDAMARTHPSINRTAFKRLKDDASDPLVPTQLWGVANDLREAWADFTRGEGESD